MKWWRWRRRWRRRRVQLRVMTTSIFVLLQSDSNVCLRVFQMRNPAAPRHFSYSLVPVAACLEEPPPVAYFWNCYLDEWLKLSHSQQVSPLLFKEEWDSCHLLMHCLPSCMQIPSPPPKPPFSPLPPPDPLLLCRVPKESPWVIDQVPWHCWKCVGCLPAHPATQAGGVTPAYWSDVISEIGGTKKECCTLLIYGHWSQAPREQNLLTSDR